MKHTMRAVSRDRITGDIEYACPDCPHRVIFNATRYPHTREVVEGDSTVTHTGGAVGLPGLAWGGDASMDYRYEHDPD